ncbi:taste receptor type 1 member 1-like [Electrophorus electricus]|uniref:taste receptor type 1 member 1-like n=1 Tax=Electrophorus electricus TaxID=8005 RepID=UPI0015CFF6BF|nr:taste receptor type 1 member 1-like [Electrophorus electricus]
MMCSSPLNCLLNFVFLFFAKHDCEASEFTLQGDYIIGGVFSVHSAADPGIPSFPVALNCSTTSFSMADYRKFEVMRFAVEEINNSSTLLPNVSIGYKIFDICYYIQNLPSYLDFISLNGQIKVEPNSKNYRHNVIGLVGPYGSEEALAVAPLFMMDLIPMISYAASSSTLSNKLLYPSFLRTVPTNNNEIQLIIQIIQWFGWNWVAFIGSNDEYSQNGLDLFRQNINGTGICLAYTTELETISDNEEILQRIESLNINVIIVFTLENYARSFIRSAIKINIKDKVWIAGDAWSMDSELSGVPGIGQIGTIFGVSEITLNLIGFKDFLYQSRLKTEVAECVNCEGGPVGATCNQVCENCTSLSPEAILNESPSFSFAVYSAVYTLAHALHHSLNCSAMGCSKIQYIPPYLLLQNVKRSNFTLQNRDIEYDMNGDPPASLSVVLWRPHKTPFFQIVGTYDTHPVQFTLNSYLIPWYQNGTVPFSNCSVECDTGSARVQQSIQKCCFQCKKCEANTYINTTVDRYTCVPCKEGEWSEEQSTFCRTRSVVYLQYRDPLCVLFLLSSGSFIVLSIGVIILFAYNYNTPVVRSAGGGMCFLMLLSLSVSNIGAFFYFGVPQPVNCALRDTLFIFFYTICLSCMAARSFQIVCIFKMAAKFPKVYSWWVRYNGQWLCLAVYTALHFIACGVWLLFGRPKPYNDNTSFNDQTILTCGIGTTFTYVFVWSFLWFLSVVCFCFSYMGKDLPKNYNEAKSITFSLVLFYMCWITYFTAYMMLRGQYIQLLSAAAQLSSSYGIMFSFFIPRSFIIIFQPQKNTPAYFQTSIQTYTKTISKM